MRLPALTLIAAAIACPAAAQSAFDIIHAENRLAARQDIARQRALAADREALVIENRARTAAALDLLREQRIAASMTAEPLTPAPLDPQMAVDAETIARLQAEALARSNARILAIKPASED
ncbi:MAG TPA: hypothetical protein VFX95_10065 [Caulobacteraceae bacterium]|nr:hypothetical protein [Caulobacteraceae bacterium]